MNLAVYLLIAGLVLLGAVYWLLRQRKRADLALHDRPPVPVNLASTTDAILLSSGYGRVTFANQHARQWFGMNGGEPDLEVMAAMVSPADAFRDLFATEGRATFQLGLRRLDASSHQLPGEGAARHMVVVLRDMAADRVEYGASTARSLVTLSEIGQHIAANQPLVETMEAILTSLSRAITYEAGQIAVWGAEAGTFTALAGQGNPDHLQGLELLGEEASSGQGYTGWVVTYRQPLLVEDGLNNPGIALSTERGVECRSYIGAPLLIGEQFLGVVQLVGAQPRLFNYEDLSLLEAAANQIAAAIDKARLYEDRVLRYNELSGVQAMLEGSATLTDQGQLVARFVQHIAQALDVQVCGLLLHDPLQERLIPQRPFQGMPDAILDAYHFDLPEGSAARRVFLRDEGWYANRLRDETLIDEIGLRDYCEPLGLRSMALVPMMIGRRRIGMVQICNRRNGENIGPGEIQRLSLFAAQAAIVLDSLSLIERDQRRSAEVRALHEIGLAAGRTRDYAALYTDSSARMIALFGAEMAGVLLFEAPRRALVPDPTFQGVDPELLQYIQIPIQGEMERLWREGEYWLCNDLSADPVAAEIGLEQLTSWVGIQQILLAPLLVRGAAIGAILICNKRGHLGFTGDDARIAGILAAQLALTLENTHLQSEIQAQISESRALRVISEILSRPASLTEMLQGALRETAHFFDSPIALVDFLDESSGALRILPEYVYGASPADELTIDVYAPGSESSALISGRSLLSNNPNQDSDLPAVYRPLLDRLHLTRLAVAPLKAGGQNLGELVVANRPGDYRPQDLDGLRLIALQISAAIERLRLRDMNDAALRTRVAELDAINRVANELALTVELDRITRVIRREVMQVTGVAECTLLMLSPREEWADVAQPEEMRRYGAEDVLPAASLPVEEEALRTRSVIAVADYADSPWEAEPASAISALIVPILYDEKPVGVIHLAHTAARVFDSQTELFVSALALKAATAYGNYASFREQISRNLLLSRRVEQLNQIFELGQVLRSERDVEGVLEAVAHAIQMSAGYAVVLISIFDEQIDAFRRVAQAGIPLATFAEIKQKTTPRSRIEGLMQEKFRISQSYFLPTEASSEWAHFLTDGDLLYHEEYVTDAESTALWQPDDLLMVPLRDSHGTMVGYISVDAPTDGRRPVRSVIEPLEIFAQQAAIAVENFWLLETVQREVDAARRERDLLERLYAVSTEIQRAADVPTRLQVVTQGIRSAGWRRVFITLRDERMEPTTLIYAGYDDEEVDELNSLLGSGAEWRQRLSDPAFYEMRLGTAFYLRYDAPWVIEHLRGGQPPDPGTAVPAGVWHPDDQVYLPIYGAENRLIGVIGMRDPARGQAPTEASIRPIELFANQAANAIEMTRLYQETSRSAEQEALFNEMMQAVTSTLDINRIVRAVAEALQRFLPFTRLTVGFYDEVNDYFDTLEVHFVNIDRMDVRPGRPIPVTDTAMGRCFSEASGHVYLLGEDETDIPYQDLAEWYAQRDRSSLIVPMTVGGIVVGVLHMGSELNNAFGFDTRSVPLVQRVANLASVAIENARLYQQTAERERFSTVLARLGSHLNATLDLPTTLASICQESLEILAVEGAYIFQADHGELLGIAGVGLAHQDFVGMRVGLDDRRVLAARVFTDQQPLYVNDVSLQNEFDSALTGLFTPRSVMGVPLLREGVALGVLVVVRIASEEPFSVTAMERAAIFATQASIAIQNARLYQEMRDLQSYTGAIVESIQQGIVVMDRDGEVTTLNNFMRLHYGWTSEAEGQHLFAYRPEYREILAGGLSNVIATGRPEVLFNVVSQPSADQHFVQNFYLYPLQQEGEVTGVVLLVEDVTERARLEADLAARAEQLTALTDVSSRLTATLEPEQVISLVLDQLGEVVVYDGVTLWLREDQNLRIASARGYGGTAAELIGLTVAIEDSALFRDIAERQQALNVLDVRQDERFPASEHRPTLNWLGAPLISKGEIIGLLALDKVEPNYYTDNDVQLTLAFANQAAVALENARLFADARRRTYELTQQTERLSLLNRVSVRLAQSLDVENIFEVALRETAEALDLPGARAVLFDLEQSIGSVIVEYPRGDAPPTEIIVLDQDSAVDYIRRTSQPLVVEDAMGDPLLRSMRVALHARDIASLMITPLVVGGQVIGFFLFEAAGERRRFTPEQVELAQIVASQAAIAAQNANLLEQSFVRTRELETLFEASQATSLTLELDTVMSSVAQQMLAALGADACSVMLWDEVEQELRVYADVNQIDADRSAPAGTIYALRQYPLRREVLQERTAIVLHRERGDEIEPHELAEMEEAGSTARMLIPLVVRENAIGLVRIDACGAYRSFSLSAQRIARTLAGQAAISIENARLNTETAAQVQLAFLINDLSRLVSAAVDMRELLPIVRTQIPSLTHAEWLYLALYERENDELSFPVAIYQGKDVALPTRPLGQDEFSWIIRHNRPLILLGDELAGVRRNLEIETTIPDLASFVAVPLSVGLETVGVLAIGDEHDPRSFGINDQRILTTVASQLAVAIQNANLFSELRRFNQELERRVRAQTEEVRSERDRLNVLYTITAELSATLDMDRVLDRALHLLAEATGAEQGLILLIDHHSEQLYRRAELGDQVAGPGPEGGQRLNEGLAGWVIQNRQSIVVDDVQTDSRWMQDSPRDRIPRATLAVLLETSDEVLGVLMLYNSQPGIFNEDHLRLAMASANQLSTSINNAELYLFIREQAERLGDMVREQQIEASKSNAILEGVADGVMFANETGEITLFNRTAERVLGIRRNEILGRPISSLRGLYGGGGRQWADTIQRWMNDPSQIRSGDYLAETLELGERVVQVTLAPVHMGDQFLGTVSVVRDITRDVEVDRMKTEFISNVSHELRTPMTSIKGYADLLVMGAVGEINEHQRDFLTVIKNNADRLSILVNDLLNISRIDSGSSTLHYQQINLGQIAHTVLDNLRGRIGTERKAMTVVEAIDEGLPDTYADPDKLMQVMTNLVDNAYQYTPENGTITLSVRMEGADAILFSVADTGIGIPEDQQSRVFDRFYRYDEDPLVIETPGTGLGLALVKELIQMHNGRIWLESQEGAGSTFYVVIPLITELPAELAQMQAE